MTMPKWRREMSNELRSRTVTTRELARVLGVSVVTVRNWVNRGLLPAPIAGTEEKWRFDGQEVIKQLELLGLKEQPEPE